MKTLIERFRNTFREILISKKGFSMIELMIVVAIMAVLAGLIATNYSGLLDKSKVQAVKADFQSIGTALELFKVNNGAYPSTEEGLKKLLDDGLIKKKKDVFLDPWGQPYMYTYPSQNSETYEIMSYGADKKEGGEGYNKDIKSWE